MDRWEYITIELEQVLVKGGFMQKAVHDTKSFNKQLNEYGQQGWELVNVFYTAPIALQGSRGTESLFAAFKRKV